MNKLMIKKSKTWKEMHHESNFSQEDLLYIKAKVELYRLLTSFREEKEKKLLTNEKLAQLSNIPRPEVSKILNGKVNVSLIRLQSLAAALGKEIVIKLV